MNRSADSFRLTVSLALQSPSTPIATVATDASTTSISVYQVSHLVLYNFAATAAMKALHAAMKLLHLEARAHSFKMSVMQALDTLLLMGLYIGGFMCVATILVIVLHSLRYRVWIGLVLPYLCTWGLDVGITKVVDPSVPTIGIGSFLAVALTFVAIAALVVEVGHLAVPPVDIWLSTAELCRELLGMDLDPVFGDIPLWVLDSCGRLRWSAWHCKLYNFSIRLCNCHTAGLSSHAASAWRTSYSQVKAKCKCWSVPSHLDVLRLEMSASACRGIIPERTMELSP